MNISEIRKHIEKAEARNFMIIGSIHSIYFKVNTIGGITTEMGLGDDRRIDNCDDNEMIKLRNWLCNLYGNPF